jgi:hypothetical protein
MDSLVSINDDKKNNNDNLHPHSSSLVSINSHKTIAQKLLNLSIISFYISTLVNVIVSNCDSSLCKAAIYIAVTGLIFQLIIFLFLVILLYVPLNYNTAAGYITTQTINGILTAITGLSLIINITMNIIQVKLPISIVSNILNNTINTTK